MSIKKIQREILILWKQFPSQSSSSLFSRYKSRFSFWWDYFYYSDWLKEQFIRTIICRDVLSYITQCYCTLSFVVLMGFWHSIFIVKSLNWVTAPALIYRVTKLRSSIYRDAQSYLVTAAWRVSVSWMQLVNRNIDNICVVMLQYPCGL